MEDAPAGQPAIRDQRTLSRRHLLQALSAAALAPVTAAVVPSRASGQGRCMLTPGTPGCNTSAIAPLFEPTGWKTAALEHITFSVADYQKEAAFYAALMGWTLRLDDGARAILDAGDVGAVIFKRAAPGADAIPPAGPRGGGRAVVESFGFVLDSWNARRVEDELRRRGLAPTADHGGNGFESFHVADPDGFDLQICNANGLSKTRGSKAAAALGSPPPFAPTGWKTVWLDHISFSVSNYKASTSFYTALLGWTPTYDEGSQNECLMGEAGDIIIRGGNPLDPNFGRGGRGGAAGGRARADHISFGIDPWDADAVKAALESRGLRAQVDTSSRHRAPDGTWVPDDIHDAPFKSYHTQTPNGYNLQISNVTHGTRLTLSNAVRPKSGGDRSEI